MILAPHTLPEEVAFVLEQAVTALSAAAKDGSEVARYGLEEVKRCMGFYSLGLDVEVQADFEEDLAALYAELEGEGDALPPILLDTVPSDFWGEAA